MEHQVVTSWRRPSVQTVKVVLLVQTQTTPAQYWNERICISTSFIKVAAT